MSFPRPIILTDSVLVESFEEGVSVSEFTDLYNADRVQGKPHAKGKDSSSIYAQAAAVRDGSSSGSVSGRSSSGSSGGSSTSAGSSNHREEERERDRERDRERKRVESERKREVAAVIEQSRLDKHAREELFKIPHYIGSKRTSAELVLVVYNLCFEKEVFVSFQYLLFSIYFSSCKLTAS